MESESPTLPDKVRPFSDRARLLAKLEGKAALWHRHELDAQERVAEFERAAQEIRDGATSVTVGRTTYELHSEGK